MVIDHYPQVIPVNYHLDEHIIVSRTHLGPTLLAANHANVGFQVDHVDLTTHSGWSVLVQGMAGDVTDRHLDATTERTPPDVLTADRAWADLDLPLRVRLIR